MRFYYWLISSSLVFSIANANPWILEESEQEREFRTAMEAKVEAEALFARRIAAFWSEQDHELVQNEIHQFLESYPNSAIKEELHAILGDIHLFNKDYIQALKEYQFCRHREVLYRQTLCNKLWCYYHLGEYESILQEGWPIAEKKDSEEDLLFLVAEAHFRKGVESWIFEERQESLQRAIGFYERLEGSALYRSSLVAIGECYQLQNNYPKAYFFYHLASQSSPETRDELLFKAAICQSFYDEKSALSLLSSFNEGSLADLAKWHILRIQFNLSNWSYVSENADLTMPSSWYWKSYSLFMLGKVDEASSLLDNCLENIDPKSRDLSEILLLRMKIAQDQNDLNGFQKSLLLWEKFTIPSNEKLSSAYFAYATLLHKEGRNEEALAIVQKVHDPSSEEMRLFYLGYLTCQMGLYAESYGHFLTLIDRYPLSAKNRESWQYFLHVASLRAKNCCDSYDDKAWFYDLLKVQTAAPSLSADEWKELYQNGIYTGYQNGFYDKALSMGEKYLQLSGGNDPSIQWIMALCAYQLELFSIACEKASAALIEKSDIAPSQIHLLLYNSYLSQTFSKKSSPQMKKEWIEKASYHLYEAYLSSDSALGSDHLLWLCRHYSQKLPLDRPFYSSVLAKDPLNAQESEIAARLGNLYQKAADLQYPLSERDYLLWSQLASFNQNSHLKQHVLEQLINFYDKDFNNNWEFKSLAYFELAKVHEFNGNKVAALGYFKEARKSALPHELWLSQYAYFHSLRIEFHLIEAPEREKAKEKIHHLLKELKNIIIQKNIGFEPLHLEAAIAYAEIRAELAPIETRAARHLFFLRKIKDDFNNMKDPQIIKYKQALSKDPFKYDLFTRMMDKIDTEISALENAPSLAQQH